MEAGQCKQTSGIILKCMFNYHLLSIIGCYALGHLSDQQKNKVIICGLFKSHPCCFPAL